MSKLSKFLHDRWGVATGDGGIPDFGAPAPSGVGGAPQGMMQPSQMMNPSMMIPSVGGMQAPKPEPRGGGWKDTIRSVGNAVQDYGPLAMAGLGAYEGWQQNKRAEEMLERAIAAEEERKKRVLEGIERRKAIQAPDLSGVFASDNPYRRKIPSVGG